MSKIDGLAVDSDNQSLYYADDNALGLGIIGVMSTDGSHSHSLIEIYGSHPRAIVVDSINRYLYSIRTYSFSPCTAAYL